MSGGYFDYNQYTLDDVADQVKELVEKNKNQFNYKPNTIKKFQETIHFLRRTAEMVQRIDWLVSGDDGEESFHKRWKEEVRPLNKMYRKEN
jgi:hypothetical protein